MIFVEFITGTIKLLTSYRENQISFSFIPSFRNVLQSSIPEIIGDTDGD